jgi:hypothetical protein
MKFGKPSKCMKCIHSSAATGDCPSRETNDKKTCKHFERGNFS